VTGRSSIAEALKAFVTAIFLVSSMSAAVESPTIPAAFSARLPSSCRQVLLCLAEDQKASSGILWCLEREEPDEAWKARGASITVTLGRHGLAWGMGEHSGRPPRGIEKKREGDGCSPIGVFALLQAFGSLAKPRGMRLPWLRCTAHHLGIDDPRSIHYNQIVDDRVVACDWTHPETMVPSNGCYQLGAVIAHNPANKPGAGSCIFMHVWQAPSVPTSGCTAMSLDEMRRVLVWLDPAKQPRLVQAIR
jgi:L,D-peptidoglycan transpeptidase YkuD (ErfK/YbiS/YcfS/YnhG family)